MPAWVNQTIRPSGASSDVSHELIGATDVDPQIVELVKTVSGILLSAGGGLGLYLIFRKIDAEIKKSLREDIAELRKENRELRGDLRKAEGRDGAEGDEL